MKKKAFIFSMDAVLAIIIFTSIILSLNASEKSFYYPLGIEDSSDAFRIIESNGFLQRELDANALSIAAQNISAKVLSILPKGRKMRVEIRQYSLDYEACRHLKDFNSCFPENERIEADYGDIVPNDRFVARGRSIIVKKQAPGDCNLNYLSFAAEPSRKIEDEVMERILLLAPEIIFFETKDPDEIGLDVDVNTSPPGSIECDKDLTVNLSTTISEDLRNIVDMMLVIDRSGSMSECTVVDGNIISQNSGSLGNGTRYCSTWLIPNIICISYDYSNWVKVADFNITGNKAFEAKLDWNGDAGSDWHDVKFYLEAPNGTKYGYYGNQPSGGCYNSYSNTIYLAIPTALSQNGAWKAYAWNDNPEVPYSITIKTIAAPKTKLAAAKEASKQFVDDANWTSNDFTGLVSYATTAKTDQPLTSNRTAVKNKIDTLTASGNTATGEGIYEANEELQEQPLGHARPGSLRFQILMSDGKTNTGRSSASAAYDAKDKNIVIFTVGFGYEVDENELRNIAEITGGEYYYALDENSLREAYKLIARRIQNISSAKTIVVPIPEGSEVINPGSGEVVDGNIVFDALGLSPGNTWYGSYTIRFDCNKLANCDINSILVPGEGSMLVYEDAFGNSYEVPIDANVVLNFLTRDLKVDIFGGRLLGKDDLYLDINVASIGFLPTGQSKLSIRFGDVNGNILDELYVPPLCGAKDENCEESFRIFKNLNVKKEGVIYAVVNEDGSISECPLGNYDAINCYGSPSMQFFTVDYYVWN